MAENDIISVEKRCKQLKVAGYSNKEIQLLIFQEYSKMYSIDTIKTYSRVIMDVEKDTEYMDHCISEYTGDEIVIDPLVEQTEEMFDMARVRGFIS